MFDARHVQFCFAVRLRTLLILLAAVAMVLSLVSHRILKHRAQQEFLQSVLARGGTVIYDYQWHPGEFADDNAVAPGPRWARRLLGEHFFADPVALRIRNATDEDLRAIRSLNRLTTLDVSKSWNVTDAGLRALAGLQGLETLDLAQTAITDEGMEYVQAIPNLTDLCLDDTDLSDMGVQYLKSKSTLTWLSLRRLRLTDAVVTTLVTLPHLDVLILEGNSMLSDETIHSLRGELRNTTIEF